MNKIGIGLVVAAAAAATAYAIVSIVDKYRREQIYRDVYDLTEDDLSLGVPEVDAEEVGSESDERVSEFVKEQVVKESWHEDYPEDFDEDCTEGFGEGDAEYDPEDYGEFDLDSDGYTSPFDEDTEYEEEEF